MRNEWEKRAFAAETISCHLSGPFHGFCYLLGKSHTEKHLGQKTLFQQHHPLNENSLLISVQSVTDTHTHTHTHTHTERPKFVLCQTLLAKNIPKGVFYEGLNINIWLNIAKFLDTEFETTFRSEGMRANRRWMSCVLKWSTINYRVSSSRHTLTNHPHRFLFSKWSNLGTIEWSDSTLL